MTRYAIVIEKAGDNYSGYVPDLPGCIAAGETVAETELSLRAAIDLHIEGMLEDCLTIPEPTTFVDFMEVSIAR
jgi:predicted RNase H-like HicB family nuclease